MVAAGGPAARAAAGQREQDAEHEEEAHRRPSTRARGGGFGGTLLRIPTSEMTGPYPFERRLGAVPDRRRPRGVPRLGAAAGTRSRCASATATTRSTDAGFGVLEATVEAAPGEDYAFVVDGIEFPDPATRWQPHGLRGRSRLLDTAAFEWTDGGFEAPALAESVLYELHVGTFTARGHVRRRDRAPARPARARDHRRSS